MPSKIVLAPNPHRSMGIDRVVIIGPGRSDASVYVLSIDGMQNSDWVKGTFTKYFLANTYWNVAAAVVLLTGVALSFAWIWWIFIPTLLVAGRFSYKGKQSGALAGERILQDSPWARDRLAEMGLIWEASTTTLAEV